MRGAHLKIKLKYTGVIAMYSEHYNRDVQIRLVPIMLLKLPIMLWCNVPEYCLFSN